MTNPTALRRAIDKIIMKAGIGLNVPIAKLIRREVTALTEATLNTVLAELWAEVAEVERKFTPELQKAEGETVSEFLDSWGYHKRAIESVQNLIQRRIEK